jgi:anti-sigma factor RsiW
VTCREFADFMAEYLSGEIPADVRERFESHLKICENCQKYLEGYEETIRLSRRAFEPDDRPLSEDVPEDLVRAVLDARRTRG